MGDVFFTQLKFIYNRHQKGGTTLCELLENPVFHPLYLMLHKNRRFIIYMEKYGRVKIKKEIDKLISSPYLRKQVADVSPESLKSFLYIKVDREYRKHTPFNWSLICTFVDSSETIIKNSDSIDLYNISP